MGYMCVVSLGIAMSRSFTGRNRRPGTLIPMIFGLIAGTTLHAQAIDDIERPPDTTIGASVPVDTIRTYSDESIAGFYTSTAIRRHIQRYRLPAGTLVHGVLVDLDGATADTAGTVVVFGHEGGYTVPHFRKPLVPPVVFAKTQTGRQTVRVHFPSPLEVSEGQIFISIERLTGDIRPLTDQVKRPPYCTEANGIERFDQILGHDDGRWETGPYAFRYTLLCDLPEMQAPMFSRDTTVDDGYGVATQATKYISCADVNGDGYVDVAAGGMLYLNERGTLLPFELQADTVRGHGPVLMHDADGDGRTDIVFLPGEGRRTVGVWTMQPSGAMARLDDVPSTPLTTVTTSMRVDVDGDGTTDLLVGGTDVDGRTVVGVLSGGKGGHIGRFDVVTWSEALPAGGVTTSLAGMTPDGAMEVLLRASDGSLHSFRTGEHYGRKDALAVRMERQTVGGLAGMSVIRSNDERASGTWERRSVMLPTTIGYANAFTGRSHPVSVVNIDDERGMPLPDLVRDGSYDQALSGCATGDLDNDGNLDHILAQRGPCRNVRVLFGKADGSYVDGTERAGLDSLDDVDDAALADLDNDGRLDVIVRRRGRTEVYRHTGPAGHGAVIDMASMRIRNAIGADVLVRLSDGRTMRRTIVSGHGLNIQEPPLVHVGTGDASIDSVEVRWPYPDARTSRHGVTKTSGRYTLTGTSEEAGSATFRLASTQRKQAVDIVIDRSVKTSASMKLQVMDMRGNHVATIHDGVVTDGEYRTQWPYTDGNGMAVTSGTYMLLCTIDGVARTAAITVVR